MNWETLFDKSDSISADQAKELLASRPPGEFTLLDVRQPGEYKEFHLPGALLIPLRELPDRIEELDRNRETIVYCRSGARSNAACQVLRGHSFPRVLNMAGGILQWQGHRVQGSSSQGLEFFLRKDFDSAFAMAYQMEAGLKEFYLVLRDETEDSRFRKILHELARFEDGHMAKLLALFSQPSPAEVSTEEPVAEGGISLSSLTAAFGNQFDSPETIYHLAMQFEAQALDLYLRLSRKYESELKLRTFYLQMAKEEQKHLDKLSFELDNLLTEQGFSSNC
ncbi:rhodanese-like domain-containing protein [Desulfomarina sp.]